MLFDDGSGLLGLSGDHSLHQVVVLLGQVLQHLGVVVHKHQAAVLGDGAQHHLKQAAHDLYHHHVVRCLGNCQMELRVGAGRARCIMALLMALHLIEAAADMVLVLVRGALGGMPGGVDLNHLTCFKHVIPILRIVVNQGNQGGHRLLMPGLHRRADIGARAHAAFQNSTAGQFLNGLAQRRARHP